MSVLYEEESWQVSKTINVNDCMKFSKKLSVNNEQIAKLLKVKEHTKTWIKNVEKVSKTRNLWHHQPVINYDVSYKTANPRLTEPEVSTPSQYPPLCDVAYTCAFCKQPVLTGLVQYQETLNQPYVLLCTPCSNKAW